MNETPGAESFADLKRREQITNPQSEIVNFPASEPLPLDCGGALAPLSIAYQTYGMLNADKSAGGTRWWARGSRSIRTVISCSAPT
jgi:homoserine O-acetyltransferase